MTSDNKHSTGDNLVARPLILVSSAQLEKAALDSTSSLQGVQVAMNRIIQADANLLEMSPVGQGLRESIRGRN